MTVQKAKPVTARNVSQPVAMIRTACQTRDVSEERVDQFAAQITNAVKTLFAKTEFVKRDAELTITAHATSHASTNNARIHVPSQANAACALLVTSSTMRFSAAAQQE